MVYVNIQSKQSTLLKLGFDFMSRYFIVCWSGNQANVLKVIWTRCVDCVDMLAKKQHNADCYFERVVLLAQGGPDDV